MADPKPKYARVDTRNPEAWAVCDRCGFWRNASDLVWQVDWAGQHLFNEQILVCRERCFDTPNEQLRTIILPPDPPPVINSRVPDFDYEEQTPIIFQFGVAVYEKANAPSVSGFSSGFSDGFGPGSGALQPLANTVLPQLPPWGAGPATIMCDQTGEVPFVLQYLTSS